MRILAVVALAGALLATAGAGGAARSGPGCRTSDAGRHAEAVFGHFATRAAADRYLALAESKGFKGFAIENDGCGDFEVESDNIERSQRAEFALEAAQSKIQVSWEQPVPPDRAVPGYLVAVFGTRRTIAAANALAWQVAGYGFRYVDIAYTRDTWRVVQPGIPVRERAAFAAEVRRTKHLTVTFATH